MVEVFGNFWFLIALTIIVTSVAATLAQAWQKVRRAEQEAALKRDMLERGLSVEDIERVLHASSKSSKATPAAPSDDEQTLEALVECLGTCGCSAQVIEEVLAATQTADPATKRAIYLAIRGLIGGITENGEEVKEEQILAVVRGLARGAGRPGPSEPAPPRDTAPGPEPDGAFQPLRPV